MCYFINVWSANETSLDLFYSFYKFVMYVLINFWIAAIVSVLSFGLLAATHLAKLQSSWLSTLSHLLFL